MKINKLSKKLLAILSSCPAAVLAGPVGGDVVGGTASINSPSTQGTVIDQSSARAIINWQSFSIGSSEYVQFNQPDASSVTLNRVTGGDPSSLLGNLSANGQVFLINPNGVYFGPGATLDVGGLVASTMDIRDEDFMNGNYLFSSSNDGSGASVVNDGIIRAREKGYVVLAGDRVENNGTIEASYGQVALLAGGEVTLDIEGDGLVNFSVDAATATELAGVENAGDLIADGGRVVLTGKVSNALTATAVNNTGLVQAHGIAEQNGEIFLLGEGGDIVNSGTLDASGTAGADGGAVIVRTDQDIDLEPGSLIDASGDGTGTGGVVRVIADGTLNVQSGSLIDVASGSAVVGQGGFVEVSGHESLLFADDTVKLGTGGTLLIDPADVDIVFSGAAANQINASNIENSLNGNNVIVAATNSINFMTNVSVAGNPSYGGNLTVGIGSIGAPCAGSSFCAAAATFTPTTGGTINMNNYSVDVNGDLGLVAQGGTIAKVNDLRGKNVTLTANTITTSSNTYIGAVRGGGGNLVVNGNVGLSTAASYGGSVSYAANSGVTLNGNTSLSGGSYAHVYVRGGGAGVTVNGNLSVSGSTNAKIDIGATGAVTLNGNVTASGAAAARIQIDGAGYGDGSGGAGSVSGSGLLTAANIQIYTPGNTNIRTNSPSVSIYGSSGGSVTGNIYVDNTARTAASTIWLGSSSGLTADIVKLAFGGAGTVNGPLTADAVSVYAGGDLTALEGFDVGASTVPGVTGDDVLTSFLAAAGITDGNGSSLPNASFISGGTLNLDVGSLTQANRYLFLAANELTLAGTSSAPNLLVQMLPFTATNSIGFESSTPGTQLTNYTESGHFSHFTGTTMALGGALHNADIQIGQNGLIDIGSKNLIFLTATPTVIGIENVIGTGLISVISAVFPTVLIDEVGGGTSGGTTVDDPDRDDEEQPEGSVAIEEGGVRNNLNLSCS
ncbi:filamentous hemagglutinin N-terminal domain-containing protein [Sulfuriflexus sp.]|uniref:two-partner secretion domain-containing protein n=1 Tax=Sulfuriflexus sp. TaxID=2015443 RepID=UPI0028CC88BD|nr:filamentous hemagglutinin N-terminal domain-containing protein [Sulfuriflexus sp.]MDT8405367.1 filamentous hemagglutinin N-terminal domain-containing protein [Sulfuriflexus sp.]